MEILLVNSRLFFFKFWVLERALPLTCYVSLKKYFVLHFHFQEDKGNDYAPTYIIRVIMG